MPYSETTFNLPAMNGLSQKQIDAHLKLYAGYVKNVNVLTEKMEEYKKDSGANAPAISELTRRYAFEWNGMRLHELYFSALGGDGIIIGKLADLITQQFGSTDSWKADMKSIAMMRGIGWALLILDSSSNTLKNIWVSDHEIGHLAGCNVLFALDVWEHAYLVDYLPAQRSEYVDVVFANLNWSNVETRLR